MVLLTLFCLSFEAHSHKWASSSFQARTDGVLIHVVFRVDAESGKEILERNYSMWEVVEKRDLYRYEQVLKPYWEKHFSVSNNKTLCPVERFSELGYAPKIDRLLLDVTFRCPSKLNQLLIESTLFEEEETTHTIISTFYHKRAKEHYVFTPGSSALINVDRLRQMPQRKFPKPGTYSMAQPPPPGWDKKRAELRKQKEQVAAQNGAMDGDTETMSSPARPTTVDAKAVGTGFVYFLWQGIVHILGGLDHVLFVISLVLVIYGWRQLAVVVTSFTVAHSLTLAFGALELISVSPHLVEPLIAASIIYVAVENMVRESPNARTSLTFGFGLIHGLGFSGVLTSLGLPPSDLVPALFGFNLGVELGQLMIVGPLFIGVGYIRKKERWYKKVKISVCSLVAAMALWWFVERLVEAATV